MRLGHNWVSRFPTRASIFPILAVGQAKTSRLTQQFFQELASVRTNWLIYVGTKLLQFRAINVHLHLVGRASQAFRRISSDREVQSDAKGHQKIAILQCKICTACRYRAWPANKKRIVARHEVCGAPCRGHRYTQPFTKFTKGCFATGESDPVARENEWAFRSAERGHDRRHLLGQPFDVRLSGQFDSGRNFATSLDQESPPPAHRAVHRSRPVRVDRSLQYEQPFPGGSEYPSDP